MRLILVVGVLLQPLDTYYCVRALLSGDCVDYYLQSSHRILAALLGALWIGVNWSFANYYLQTACLLRMTLRSKTPEDFVKVKNRKKWLFAIEYSMDLAYLAVTVYLIATAGTLT